LPFFDRERFRLFEDSVPNPNLPDNVKAGSLSYLFDLGRRQAKLPCYPNGPGADAFRMAAGGWNYACKRVPLSIRIPDRRRSFQAQFVIEFSLEMIGALSRKVIRWISHSVCCFSKNAYFSTAS
jgi:hypothetical protein